MDEHLTALSGTLGFFWTDSSQAGEDEHALRGYLEQDGESVKVQMLVENPMGRFEQTPPPISGIGGILTTGTVYLPYLTGGRQSINLGAIRASQETLTSTAAIFNLDEIYPTQIFRLGLRFRGLTSWAGWNVESVTRTPAGEGSGETASITLRAPETELPRARVSQGLILEVSVDWSSTGAGGRRTIDTSLEFSCRATRPRPATDLIPPLHAVQCLVSAAFNAWVPATPGPAHAIEGGRVGTYWDGWLMSEPADAVVADLNAFPIFTMQDVGGPRGLGRWVRICAKHPRAVWPVMRLYSSRRAPEEALVTCAQAAMYWVDSHKQSANGTGGHFPRGQMNTEKKVELLIDRVGRRHWANLIGPARVAEWTTAFSATYDGLRHDPSLHIPPQRALMLALSGRVLVQLALLREAAGNQTVSARFARDHRMLALARMVEESL